MRIITGLLTLLTVLSVCFGFRPAYTGDFPFHVLIREEKHPHAVCGGLILTSKWVLSARDCLKVASTLLVTFGSADASKPEGEIRIKNYIYEPDKNNNTLGLLELESEIKFSNNTKQVKLLQKNASISNETVKFSGWNLLNLGNSLPSLGVIDEFQLEVTECKVSSNNPFPLRPDELCGYDKNYPDYFETLAVGSVVTKGDVVIGIMSKAPLSPASPVILLRPSFYTDWLKEKLGQDYDKILWENLPPNGSTRINSFNVYILLIITIIFSKLL